MLYRIHLSISSRRSRLSDDKNEAIPYEGAVGHSPNLVPGLTYMRGSGNFLRVMLTFDS